MSSRIALAVGLFGIGLIAFGATMPGVWRPVVMLVGLASLVVGKLALGGDSSQTLAECWQQSLLFRVNITGAAIVLAAFFVWANRGSDPKSLGDVLPGSAVLVVVLVSDRFTRLLRKGPRANRRPSPRTEVTASR